MSYRKKYQAFTIWEVLIAIVLTSLIVTFSYGSYRTFVVLIQKDQKALTNLNDMVILERELFRLVESSESMELEGRILYFNFPESYSFIEFADSLFIVSIDKMNEEREYDLIEWSAGYLNENTLFVGSFEILCQYEGESYSFSLKKTYPKTFVYSYLTQ